MIGRIIGLYGWLWIVQVARLLRSLPGSNAERSDWTRWQALRYGHGLFVQMLSDTEDGWHEIWLTPSEALSSDMEYWEG